jgi:flagellar motor switch protein FliM
MSDVLSQSEIESLLAALDPATAAGPGRGGASDARRHSGGDSRRPARVGPELLRALWTLHEGFAQAFEASLRGLLTSTVEVRSAGIDELTYGEFVSGVDDPTCLAALNADPLGATFLCQFESAIVFPIVDRLLGGEGTPASAMPRRPLTDIELRLLWRVADLAAGALRGVWRDVCDLKPKVVQVEGQLHLITFVPPESPIVQLSFDMSLGDSAGTMNVCLPVSALEPLAGRLLGTAGANRVSDQRETAGNGVDSAHADAWCFLGAACQAQGKRTWPGSCVSSAAT